MTVMLPNDNALLTAFLNIASLLNHHFQITPVLYGSLGLSLRLGKNLSPDDIDILVPNAYMTTQWPDLLTVMENCGYRLENLQEHQFVKDYHKLSFADNDLANYVGIVWEQIPMLHDSDVTFKLLTLEQYLTVYQKSLTDSYRQVQKHGKDRAKITDILTALRKIEEEKS